jgi:hypothetical protein
MATDGRTLPPGGRAREQKRLATFPQPYLLVVAMGAVLGGCESGEVPSAPVEVRDSAGVTIVLSREARWKEGEEWTVPAEPVLTLGALAGEEEYQFSEISAAVRRSNGDFVVADAGSRTVRLYNEMGVFKRRLGGPGSGPGEFQRPTQILAHTADSIFVWDDAAFRLTKFDPDGAFVGVRTVSREQAAKGVAPPMYPGSAVVMPGGDVLVRLVEKGKDLPTAGRFRGGSGVVRMSPDVVERSTLMLFGDVEQVLVDSPWGPLPVTPAFAKNTTITVQATEERACVGDQEGPGVMCFGPDGMGRNVRWLAEPVGVSGDEPEVAAWRDSTVEMYGQKLSPADVQKLIEQVPEPETRPQYSDIELDHVGNLWVMRGPAGPPGTTAVEHLVFDPVGVLLGSVSMPAVRILEIGTDYVLAVHHDELEVEYLQVFGIIKPSTSGSTR